MTGDSGKNVFLLTGKPRVGKSTLTKNMIHRLGSERCGGFYTEEIRDDNERIGFKCVAVDGESLEIASIKNNSIFKIGRYGVDVKGFEDFAIPLLESSFQSKKVIVIDEIGFMQMLSLPFQEWIRKIIFDHQHVVLGTVPVDSHPEIDKIKNHFRVKIIHINEDNRDTIADEIMQMILTKIE
jgi:nucleoside-triphosphatase THEP1